jgi:hypothetical protein
MPFMFENLKVYQKAVNLADESPPKHNPSPAAIIS